MCYHAWILCGFWEPHSASQICVASTESSVFPALDYVWEYQLDQENVHLPRSSRSSDVRAQRTPSELGCLQIPCLTAK